MTDSTFPSLRTTPGFAEFYYLITGTFNYDELPVDRKAVEQTEGDQFLKVLELNTGTCIQTRAISDLQYKTISKEELSNVWRHVAKRNLAGWCLDRYTRLYQKICNIT